MVMSTGSPASPTAFETTRNPQSAVEQQMARDRMQHEQQMTTLRDQPAQRQAADMQRAREALVGQAPA